MNIIKTAAITALSVLSMATAFGQEQTYGVSSTRAVGAAKILNTKSFFPQIDESIKIKPFRPANMPALTEPIGEPNDLVPGGVIDMNRFIPGAKFPAIGFTGSVPPDPDLAAGPTSLVAVVNTEVAFFDKNGTKLFQQSGEAFFQGVRETNFVFDPKVFYDRINNRFVMLFLELGDTVSNFLVAVSDDSNPVGNWNRYKVPVTVTGPNGTSWLDYPGWGYNKDFYVGTGNLFTLTGSGGGNGVNYVLLPIAPMLTGAPVTASVISDPATFTVQVSKNPSTTSKFVYGASRGNSTSLRLAAIDTETKTLTTRNVTVPASSGTGPAPSTNSNTLDSVGSRYFTANLRDQHLVVSHNTNGGGGIEVRWYDVLLNGWPNGVPALNQSGNISSPGLSLFLPAVNMNAAGDIGALFAGSSSTVTANIMQSGRKATDPAGTMSTPVVLESSVGNNYQDGRWGDYFGVDIDPADDLTFWGIGMNVAASNGWRTSIFSWTISKPGLQSIVLSPSTVRGGLSTTGTVNLDDVKPNDVVVALSVNIAGAITMPASVTIPAGSLSASFNIQTNPVIDQRVVEITANAGAVLGSRRANLTIRPIGLIEPLDLVPGRVNGGNIVRGIVKLEAPAPAGGASVYMSTTNSLVAEPARNWVVVPAGATTAAFDVNTFGVEANTLIYINATRNGVTVQNDITVYRAPVLGMAFTPSPVKGGNNVQVEISIDGKAPAGGAIIQLKSSNTSLLTVPTSVTIPAGKRSTFYTASSKVVTSNRTVTVTATRVDSVLSRNLTITP